jgi:hypothetical protein
VKNNIDSPLLISGITKNENNKEKERKHWIPNQVGDDIGVVFGDDIGVVFGNDSGDVIPATYFCHSERLRESIKCKKKYWIPDKYIRG